jgi:two-component system response regulator HydG
LRVLEAVGGNKTMAAHVLGFDRRTLYRKLDAYGVDGKLRPADGEARAPGGPRRDVGATA